MRTFTLYQKRSRQILEVTGGVYVKKFKMVKKKQQSSVRLKRLIFSLALAQMVNFELLNTFEFKLIFD